MNKKQLSVALLGGVMIGAVGFTAIGVSAQADLTDEERTERIAERQERKEAALDEKVSEGVITEEQKEQIIAFMEELRAEKGEKLSRDELEELSEEERDALFEERSAAKEARQEQVEAFFDELGVDKDEVFDGSKRGGRHHKGSKSLDRETEELEVEVQSEEA